MNIIFGNETKAYLILSIVCIAGIILFNVWLPSGSTNRDIFVSDVFERDINLDVIPLSLSLFVLFFFAFLLFGIVNAVIILINKINKKPLFPFDPPLRLECIKNAAAAKLLFYIVYFYLVIYFLSLQFATIRNLDIQWHFHILIVLNLVVNIFIVISVGKLIPSHSLCFFSRIKDFLIAMRLYSVVVIIILILTILLIKVSEIIHLPPPDQPAVDILLSLKNNWFIVLFSSQIALIAPISEEFLFRGFIYKYLRGRVNFLVSSIITSLIFAFLHHSLFGFFIIFVISMALCYIYEKTQSIATAIFFHSIHNAASLIVLFAAQQLFSR
ncbi:MAG: type II CAAX endopeptidase family protein [Candidatus Omnitrophota bacterium]